MKGEIVRVEKVPYLPTVLALYNKIEAVAEEKGKGDNFRQVKTFVWILLF